MAKKVTVSDLKAIQERVPKDNAKYAFRVLVCGDYLVFYVVKEAFIQVRRVVHGKRKYGFLL